jgi:hypothetical protein
MAIAMIGNLSSNVREIKAGVEPVMQAAEIR